MRPWRARGARVVARRFASGARLAMTLGEHHPGDGDDHKRDADEYHHLGGIRAVDAGSGDGNGFQETPYLHQHTGIPSHRAPPH